MDWGGGALGVDSTYHAPKHVLSGCVQHDTVAVPVVVHKLAPVHVPVWVCLLTPPILHVVRERPMVPGHNHKAAGRRAMQWVVMGAGWPLDTSDASEQLTRVASVWRVSLSMKQ